VSEEKYIREKKKQKKLKKLIEEQKQLKNDERGD